MVGTQCAVEVYSWGLPVLGGGGGALLQGSAEANFEALTWLEATHDNDK